MTEFEMVSLANDMQANLATYGGSAFTTVSSFLVAGYLVAHRLTRFMVLTVVVVYTLWLFGSVGNTIRTVINLTGLSQHMHLLAEQGKGLEWHLAANAPPSWVPPAIVMSIVAVFAFIYIASIVFFFQCRRMNRKAESVASMPKA